MKPGRYAVTDGEAYGEVIGCVGDTPDEIHVLDADGDVEIQELWHARGEGRFATVPREDVERLAGAVAAK